MISNRTAAVALAALALSAGAALAQVPPDIAAKAPRSRASRA